MSNCCQLNAKAERITKAIDPLDDEGFKIIAKRLSLEIQRSVVPIQVRMLKLLLAKLSLDWLSLTIPQRIRIIRELETELNRLSSINAAAILGLRKFSTSFANKVHRAIPEGKTREASGESADSSLKITEAFVQRRGHRRTVEVVASLLSSLTRLDESRTSEEISIELQGRVARFFNDTHYWDTVSTTHLNTLRSFEHVLTLDRVNVDRLMWVSVIDDVTTDICRFLDGKTFSVSNAVNNFRNATNILDANGLDEFMIARPMITRRKVDETLHVLEMHTSLGKIKIANEFIQGSGSVYEQLVDDALLEQLGVGLPPIHFSCRSQIRGL